MQQLPSVAGNAANPNMNNGGGTGGSFVSLRGLGTNRTLDPRRRQAGNQCGCQSIPTAAIERIEVLSDGASAIYGSDAIAGVVNFILRKDYQGAELQLSYGISDKDDGARKGFSLTFGQSSDKGSIMGGIDYNKTDQILASHREFSKVTYNLSRDGSTVTPGGSAASPSGLYGGFPQFAGCSYYGYGTFDANAPGGNGIPAHFRCFNGLGPGAPNGGQGDTYNYAAINLITTPQERTNFFLNGDYKLTDSVDAYFQVFHNSTNSAAQLAPVPLGLASGGLTIGAGNPYNPFGVDIGAGFAEWRRPSTCVCRRSVRASSISVRGPIRRVSASRANLFDTDWQYDLWGQLWPSGVRVPQHQLLERQCGENGVGKQLHADRRGPAADVEQLLGFVRPERSEHVDVAEAVLFAQCRQRQPADRAPGWPRCQRHVVRSAGRRGQPRDGRQLSQVLHPQVQRHGRGRSTSPPASVPAGLSSLCNTPYIGQFDVKEAYAELFVPILKDLPFIHSLNLTLGDRYSKYSNFGNTNNWKVALEYRPIEDVLLRGTISEVFRAPNTTESYTGLTASFDSYTRNAGIGEPRSTNGAQIQTIFSGASVGNYAIQPETARRSTSVWCTTRSGCPACR